MTRGIAVPTMVWSTEPRSKPSSTPASVTQRRRPLTSTGLLIAVATEDPEVHQLAPDGVCSRAQRSRRSLVCWASEIGEEGPEVHAHNFGQRAVAARAQLGVIELDTSVVWYGIAKAKPSRGPVRPF